MSKTFKEVFPTLKLDNEVWHLLENADVTKIGANHDHNHIRIYLSSNRLIFKKNIWKMEEAIEKQIFQGKDMVVKIIESYQLSEQYTPETLLDVYKDSILDELKQFSVLEYNLLRTATMEFDKPNHMILTLDLTIIAKTRTNEIVEFLEYGANDRIGHASAAGVAPNLWVDNLGGVIPMPQGMYLDDLIFACHFIESRPIASLSGVVERIKIKIHELGLQVYGEGYAYESNKEV